MQWSQVPQGHAVTRDRWCLPGGQSSPWEVEFDLGQASGAASSASARLPVREDTSLKEGQRTWLVRFSTLAWPLPTSNFSFSSSPEGAWIHRRGWEYRYLTVPVRALKAMENTPGHEVCGVTSLPPRWKLSGYIWRNKKRNQPLKLQPITRSRA